ncbi:unnamed protein product [Oikopleura dioica]|uniref:SprT-like domain-containing protein n=1 Tax=Oikopleura dioica TaxID=34765 RepID=E4XN00_OIKDI|nr:unnamed protein product [Oikopleura dioica]
MSILKIRLRACNPACWRTKLESRFAFGKLFHKPQTFFTDKHLSENVYVSMAPHLNNRLCDREWEAMDPNPNIHELFQYFSERFFWGSLGIVQLEWSKRMYTCAGICYYQRRGNAENCIIRLSEPLLKLRSRGDLVNTLIHEMIHAFLFVTHDDRDRDGHGPRFQAHGARINAAAKTNITIYHDWHDESNYYKQHVWRCNGPCKDRKPFFGWIRRTANRKPGKNDRWWAQHQASCNGEFIKVSEPEKKKKENTKKRKGSEEEF